MSKFVLKDRRRKAARGPARIDRLRRFALIHLLVFVVLAGGAILAAIVGYGPPGRSGGF